MRLEAGFRCVPGSSVAFVVHAVGVFVMDSGGLLFEFSRNVYRFRSGVFRRGILLPFPGFSGRIL